MLLENVSIPVITCQYTITLVIFLRWINIYTSRWMRTSFILEKSMFTSTTAEYAMTMRGKCLFHEEQNESEIWNISLSKKASIKNVMKIWGWCNIQKLNLWFMALEIIIC